ncbi:hypothetical protein EV426DRAFT_582376 [Tirmania nivea]|nr:hypothetical protein EV426DRAFT_582376 [Tirmania nivea]
MFRGFDSEIPEQTADAMRQQHGNTDFAYTATGEVVDLSSLQGLYADEDEVDDDGKSRRSSFSLTRSTTGLNPNEKSYYFPEDPDTPNWKPVTMRPLYLTILQFLSLAIIGFCEFLYQYSVHTGKKTGSQPYLTSFKDLGEMRLIDFALWKYLPTVIAVVFGVLVQLSDAEVKRVEPYFQLSRKPKGARAGDSLNIEYSTFWAVLCPLKAIRHKHWAVMISSITAILAFGAVPPLQSVFLNLDMGKGGKKGNHDDQKFLIVDKIWTRLLEAVMLIIFTLIGALQWVLLRRKTGLVGDPSGIAGVAAMANKAHILMDFSGLDLAGTKKIHKQLSQRTYILHKSCLWQAEFLKEHERPTEIVKDQNAHPLLLRLEGGLPLLGYLVLVMIMLPFLMGKASFQKLLSESTWFLTVLSISIKMFWEIIDRDLRMLQPFYLLYRRHAHSDVLTLDYTATIPGWIIVKTLQNKHYLLSYITTITLLNEVLTVCMGSLDPVSGDETPRSQKISFALAETIMFGQVIGVSVVLYLRRHPFLPRQPGTISSVLAYIYASHMLPDFDNMETKSTNERRKILAAKNKTYGFGWFKGLVDGKWHVGIDQEELLRSYKYREKFLDSIVQSVPSGLDQW